MLAYVTSIGEGTTDICVWLLEKYGYEVVLDDRNISWKEKYTEFLNMDTDVLRVDADILVNKNCQIASKLSGHVSYGQYSYYCLYANMPRRANPIYYTKNGLRIARRNVNKMSDERPECSILRTEEMQENKVESDVLMGVHGFYQSCKDVKRHKENKKLRKQEGFDFELAEKLCVKYG